MSTNPRLVPPIQLELYTSSRINNDILILIKFWCYGLATRGETTGESVVITSLAWIIPSYILNYSWNRIQIKTNGWNLTKSVFVLMRGRRNVWWQLGLVYFILSLPSYGLDQIRLFEADVTRLMEELSNKYYPWSGAEVSSFECLINYPCRKNG